MTSVISRILAALAALLLLAAMAGAAPRVTGIELENPSIADDAEILRVFRPKVGERYTVAETRRSVGLITAMPGIESVDVLTRSTGEDKVAIRLVVKQEPLVKTIKLAGVKLFDADEIKASFLTRPDDPAYRMKMDADLKALLDRYREEGYEEATGNVKVDTDGKGHWSAVTFDVIENEPKRITAYGNLGDADRIGRERFLDELGLRAGSPASAQKLREGVKRATAWCFDEGYPEARIHEAGYRREGESVYLDAVLELGARTEIAFIDADGESVSALREAAKQEYGQTLDGDRIRRISSIIKEELELAGYLNAKVESSADGDAAVKKIEFRIDRGERVTIRKIVLSGNSAIRKGDIEDVIEAGTKSTFGSDPYDAEIIEGDLSRIQQLYIARGMLDTSVKVEEVKIAPNGKADIFIRIDEGKKYVYGELSFRTDGCFPDAKAAEVAKLKSGSPADPAELEKARVRLLAELSRRGYANGMVERKTKVMPEEERVDVQFFIRGGIPQKFGTIAVTGNARTKSNVVLRELTFKQGQPWNEQEIITSRQNIFRLGFFEMVEFREAGLPREDGTVDLLIEVRELDAGHIDYGVGYGTEEGVKAFAEIGHSNIFGGGRSSSLRAELTGPDRVYTANYTEPWILGFPFALKLSASAKHQELKSYNLDSYALQSSVVYDLTKQLKASLIHTLEDDVISDVSDVAFVGDKNFVASTLSPLVVFDSRNDPFNPRRGFLHSLQFEWASRSIGSELEYSKLTGSMSGYFSAGRFTLATLARGGAAEYYGRNELLPLNKRFFLGGRSTVRGWQKDEIGDKAPDGTSLGGDLMANLKAELRVNVFKDFAIAGFWDAGNVWFRDAAKPRWSDMRQGAGPSVRYNTPVGPVSLDVGWKLDRLPGESAYEWYFTIGNVF